ncbi:hypothetical protein [Acinetobacter sp. 10FS3-1]|uniref:hypothetical protein n=2 Tax=Acinetobacter sp. 10FS3-1 TaxID=2563897 RepID=UPI00157BD26C|nr:hypothetical protein E5Y90_06640 [Acinetobacter sp. 10FS3-1]
MKKLLLITILMLSTTAFAVEVNSVRGSTSYVKLGFSLGQMFDVLGDPESSYNHVIHDRNGWPHKATSYRYTVNGQKYTITVVDGRVYKIDWER